MVLKLVTSAIPSIHFKKDRKLIADYVFKLHYFASCLIFLVCSALVTGDYFADPINCFTPGVQGKLLNHFCWIQGTFTLPKEQGGPHHGLGTDPYSDPDDVRYHAWYQWTAIMLFGQAFLFYLPFHIWKSLEKGHMQRLVQDLKGLALEYMFDIDDLENEEKVKFAAQRQALVRHFAHNLGKNNLYAGKYVLMEFANLINIIFQIYMMNVFLGGEFVLYGIKMFWNISGDYMKRTDIFTTIFPRVTKCTFHDYASAGIVNTKDAICVLPFNMVNEKIYMFLWYWSGFLAIVTVLHFATRLMTMASKSFRKYQALNHVRGHSRPQVAFIVSKCRFGDWLILLRLLENIDELVMREIISELRMELRKRGQSYHQRLPIQPERINVEDDAESGKIKSV